ncbi:MAG: HDOD domain-containing protein [Gallionella sp.]
MSQPDFADKFFQGIENGEIILPTMPDWVAKLQGMLNDINIPASQIIAVVNRDPAFTAQLIKIANSAAYGGKPKVENITSAVARLGFKMLHNLIISTTMSRLSVVRKPLLKKRLALFWEHSREVATISYVLAKSQKQLNPDLAMLAGLTHDIGVLSLLIYVERETVSFDNERLESLIRKYSANLGKRLLQSWEFPKELVNIPVAHHDLQYKTGSDLANYADIVTVANLLNRVTAKMVEWKNISAVERLGLDPLLYRDFFDRFDRDIADAGSILFHN